MVGLAAPGGAVHIVAIEEIPVRLRGPAALCYNVPQVVQLPVGVPNHRELALRRHLDHLDVRLLGEGVLKPSEEKPGLDERELPAALQPLGQGRDYRLRQRPLEPRVHGASGRVLLSATPFGVSLLGGLPCFGFLLELQSGFDGFRNRL